MRHAWVEQVDDLLDRDFPDILVHTSVDGQRAVSGPGFHLVAVLTSEALTDSDLRRVREPEWEAHLASGVSDFVDRFGRPTLVDAPAVPSGGAVSWHFGTCAYHCWALNRFVALGIGRRDPLELFVGVGIR